MGTLEYLAAVVLNSTDTYILPLSPLAGGKLRHTAAKWSAQAAKQARKELGN